MYVFEHFPFFPLSLLPGNRQVDSVIRFIVGSGTCLICRIVGTLDVDSGSAVSVLEDDRRMKVCVHLGRVNTNNNVVLIPSRLSVLFSQHDHHERVIMSQEG